MTCTVFYLVDIYTALIGALLAIRCYNAPTVTFLDSGLIHVCKDHDPAGPRFLIHARIAHCTIPVPLAYQGACCAACDGPGLYVSLPC